MKYLDFHHDKQLRNTFNLSNKDLNLNDIGMVLSNIGERSSIFLDTNLDKGELLTTLNSIDPHKKECQKIIIAPTRERAYKLVALLNKNNSRKKIKIENLFEVRKDSFKGSKITRKQILVGTPGSVLFLLQLNSKITDSVTTVIIEDLYKDFYLGYREDIEEILNLLNKSTTVLITADRFNSPISNFYKKNLKDYIKVEKNSELFEKKKSVKIFTDYLNSFRKKNILVIVKKRKQLELLKVYLEKHGYLASSAYDLLYNLNGHNYIYLVTKDEYQNLSVKNYDVLINYNCKNLDKKSSKLELPNLKDIGQETRDLLGSTISNTKENMKKVEKSSRETGKETLEVLKNSIANKESSNKIRNSLFEAILPTKEIETLGTYDLEKEKSNEEN